MMMAVGKSRALGLGIALAATAVVLGGCGSDGGGAASGSLPGDTAEELAAMSDGIADALEAGETCDAAQKADDLQAAVFEADIPDDLRAEVEAGADQLVNEVNCEDNEDRGDRTTTEGEGGDEEQDEGSSEGSEGNGGAEEEISDQGSVDLPGRQGEGFTPPGQEGKIEGGP